MSDWTSPKAKSPCRTVEAVRGPGVKDGTSASFGQVLLCSSYGSHYRRTDQMRENGWWSSMRRWQKAGTEDTHVARRLGAPAGSDCRAHNSLFAGLMQSYCFPFGAMVAVIDAPWVASFACRAGSQEGSAEEAEQVRSSLCLLDDMCGSGIAGRDGKC